MNEMKTCNKCNETLPITEFYTTKDSRNGKGRIFPECKACKGEIEKGRYKDGMLRNSYDDIRAILAVKDELMEIVEQHRHCNPKTKIVIETNKLTGDVVTKSFKIYKKVVDEFELFMTKNKQYQIKDIISMALLEYMQKHK
jgi:hypothetical protein